MTKKLPKEQFKGHHEVAKTLKEECECITNEILRLCKENIDPYIDKRVPKGYRMDFVMRVAIKVSYGFLESVFLGCCDRHGTSRAFPVFDHNFKNLKEDISDLMKNKIVNDLEDKVKKS